MGRQLQTTSDGTASAIALAAAGAGALLLLLQYQPAEFPLIGDRAYFVYLGQLVLRGESIYANTFMGYPPLGQLLSAASMWLGELFALPSYYSPRVFAIVVSVASLLLMQRFTYRATGSQVAGLIAAAVLVGFSQFGPMSVGTLEPKMLVNCFSLAACVALQRRSWVAAGLWTGFAAACWQPALLLLPISLSVAAWNARSTRVLLTFASGVACGLLPALIYLGATDAWTDFWIRSVTIPMSSQLPGAAGQPLYWVYFVARQLAVDVPFFIGASAGFVAFALGSLSLRGHRALGSWLDPRLGGMPLLLLGWAGFNSIDFQGFPDILPLLPAAAFWVGWGANRAASAIETTVSASATNALTVAGRGFLALVLAATVWHAATAAFRFALPPGRSLPDQQRLVGELIAAAGPEARIDGYLTDSLFAIGEIPAPNGFLRLGPVFEQFLHLFEASGCDGLIDTALAREPVVVVMFARSAGVGLCVQRLHGVLRAQGYSERATTFPNWRVLSAPGLQSASPPAGKR